MLKLEKLELRGFKSFCDHSEFHLTDTVTAVVGPNGCGKSNLADSITWVLGEQSARSLRGGKMEDVIFQGTHSRQPVGLAEVVLTFVAQREFSTKNGNSTHEDSDIDAEESGESGRTNGFHLTVSPGERITIGRRLYRSGESEYLLNGRRVRLRDIYDLFSGTGLGPGHYAIIGQGHVGEIITAKPFERRVVVEAAAGITRFRLRQRTIELRLQSARQNLARIDDLIDELDRQVRSLKRQAAKARRYRRLKEELRGLLRIVFASESSRIESDLEAVDHRLAEATRVHADLNAEVASLEVDYRAAIEATRRQEASLSEARDHLSSIDLQLERTRSQHTSCQEHIANLHAKRVELERDESRLRQRSASVETGLQKCDADLGALASSVNVAQGILAERESIYKSELERVKIAERELEASRQRILEETNNQASLRHAGQQVEVDLDRVETKLKGLHAERDRALSKRAELETQQTELSQIVEHDRVRMDELRRRLSQLEEEHKQARGQQMRQAQALESLERERLTVEERLTLLLELDRQHAYCSPAVQRLFEQEAAENQIRLIGTLADFVNVKCEHERAVESALGHRLQTVLVPTVEDALRSIAFLAQTNSGQGAFLVVGLQGGGQAPEMGRTEAADHDDHMHHGGRHSTPLLDVLNLRSGLSEAFERAFPEIADARIVADLETALEFAFDDEARMFVTSQGHRVRAGRLLAGGSEDQNVKSLLAIKREILELRARVGELEHVAAEAKDQLNASAGTVDRLEGEINSLRAQQQVEEKTTLERALQLANLETEQSRAEQHLRVVDFELAQTEADLQELHVRRDRLFNARQLAEAELARIKTEGEEAHAALLEIRQQADGLLEELSAKRTEVAALIERQRSLQADYDRLHQELSQLTDELEGNARGVTEVEEETNRLTTSLAAIRQSLTQLEADRLQAESHVQQSSQQLEESYRHADDQNTALDGRRAHERQAREEISQLNVQRAQLVSDARHLHESCMSELSQPLEDVISLVGEGNNPIETQVDLDDVEAVKHRVQELRRGLEDMGPVNMVALEDLQAQEERLEFMQDQRRDVMDSIGTTEKALEEIKRRSRRRFVEAFESINANFSEVFQELFGGGQGRMVLLDEENPLESGIDIIAQPPGKRLQNMMLLSGGEKSMTAIALLLAIFRYRPSPFCLLDEVDAQLDEVNVRRFAKKIEEMGERTQFILITHNKTTMQAAQALHGVTMEEPGISKLVSVRLK